ncbi:MAG: hypothetical protein U1E86_05085 [Burkholderiaceae bacterium]
MNQSAEQRPDGNLPDAAASTELGGPERIDVNRRQALLKAAARGVPVLVGAVPGAALAASSAFRAAERDKAQHPALEVASADGWMRKKALKGKLKRGSNIVVDPVYKIGDTYYRSNGTVIAFVTPPTTFVDETTVYLLGLFQVSDAGVTNAGVWPVTQRTDLQGLHCSSWSSISPNTAAPYSCTGA